MLNSPTSMALPVYISFESSMTFEACYIFWLMCFICKVTTLDAPRCAYFTLCLFGVCLHPALPGLKTIEPLRHIGILVKDLAIADLPCHGPIRKMK